MEGIRQTFQNCLTNVVDENLLVKIFTLGSKVLQDYLNTDVFSTVEF